MKNALKWFELSSYEKCRRRPPRVADFSIEDLSAMERNGKIELVEDGSESLSTVNAFTIPEPKKTRRRPIFETLTNRDLGRELLQPMHHLQRAQVRRQTPRGSCAFSFDFASYYDAFVLPPPIRALFRFRCHNDKLWQLRTLAMGQRQACEIAQCATDILSALPSGCPNVHVATMIDNVRFSAPLTARTELLAAVRTFLVRVADGNLCLNDVDATTLLEMSEDELWEQRVESEDFLGEHYDYITGTVQNTMSTVEKALFIDRQLATHVTLTKRQVAAMYGLILYARHTINAPLAPYFTALRFLRTLEGHINWDARAPPIPVGVCQQLRALLAVIIANHPVLILPARDRGEIDTIIVVDASSAGWGAIVANHDSGGVFGFSEPWPQPIRHSAVAEPRAIKRAIARFLHPTDIRRVLIVTDHSPIVWAAPHDDGSGGYARGYELNSLFYFISFYKSSFFFSFVSGVNNLADTLSRDGVLTPGKKKIFLDWEYFDNFVQEKTIACGVMGG